MKALVLAGGSGTRLRPITHTSAKQLVPVGNKPVIDFGLEAIAAAGITDVGIIVGHTGPEIEAYVGDGSRYGISVTYVHQPDPLGLAHAVLTAEDFLGRDDFVMYLGDNLIAGGITEFVEQFEANRPDAQILLAKVRDPERFGVAELGPDGHVSQLVEKPSEPKSDLALVGVYLFSGSIMDACHAIEPSDRGELEITDAIQWMIDDGQKVAERTITGWWKDTGKLYDMLEANRIVLDTYEPRMEGSMDEASEIQGRVVIEEGAELVNSTVRGPAIIGKRTRLENTFVGPYTAIYHDCVVTDSEIEHSIVLEETTITDVGRMEDSLIGKQVEVGRSRRRPAAMRLMLGDHSRVGLV
ncbi:glucose-1-phosphate thymidylyltransferase [Euzebya sp.]|uniref:glucose-1-phosphate thymidylyltransferase n=1 Tax=Euzebya sp. TaxID=1971409 RepID=UPI003513B065